MIAIVEMEREPNRAQEKFRRLLILVDELAPLRQFKGIDDVLHMMQERGYRVSRRTVQRDLDLLASMGFIESSRLHGSHRWALGYRLNLRSTEGLQMAALRL